MARRAIKVINGCLRCSRCHECKPTSEFSKRIRAASGFDYWCRTCTRASSSRWHADMPPEKRDVRYRLNNERRKKLRQEKREMSKNEMVTLTDRLAELNQKLTFDKQQHDKLNAEMQEHVASMFASTKEYNAIVERIKELAKRRSWIIDAVNQIVIQFDRPQHDATQ